MKKLWLVSFNALTLLAWLSFFVYALANELVIDKTALILLAVAQGLAIFEILNSVLGIAGANWLLTTMQVLSRFLVVGLLIWIPLKRLTEINETCFLTGFALITIAWSITEIVRAAYYITELTKTPVSLITFCRYTFFLLLYPIGVFGEFLVMFDFWEYRSFQFDIINSALALIALSYFVFFPKLFGHMWKQRKKKLA